MLETRETEADGVVTLELSGTFDLYSAPEFNDRFDSFYKKGLKKFIIDISGLEHVDSSGLAAFLRMFTFLEERQGRSVVIGARGTVARIFELTNLDQRIIVLRDREQALRVLDKI